MNPEVREKIDELFIKKGLRMTRPREIILEAAFSDKGEHFTAEELYEKARSIDPKASLATLYRTVSLLVEGGLLHEIDLGKGVVSYDPNFIEHPHHNHLICVDCSEVIEFEDQHISVLEDCITKRLGFSPATKSIQIKAKCDKLRKSGSCQNLISK
ncbi:MAG: transcriptional repressor [Verrucomicrobiales bacterium]|nr:transcriptional repressor [Verrucomicrobiales bacterium]